MNRSADIEDPEPHFEAARDKKKKETGKLETIHKMDEAHQQLRFKHRTTCMNRFKKPQIS